VFIPIVKLAIAAAAVESLAKIATYALPDSATAEALWPRHRPPQPIILQPDAAPSPPAGRIGICDVKA
jgi:hypothetical protein